MRLSIRRTFSFLTLILFAISLTGLPGTASAKSAHYPTTQQAKLLASDPENSDNFGAAIDLSGDGNTAVIAATGDDTAPNLNNGAIYIYVKNGTSWVQQAKLLANDPATGDLFGHSVSISGDGNTVIAGTYVEDTPPNTDNGAVYVFTRNGTTWTQQAKLQLAGVNSREFGFSVALSSDGNYALIGARANGAEPNNRYGAAYVFIRSGSTWSQQSELVSSVPVNFGWFGWSVAINSDGTVALIGEPGSNDGAGYIFVRNGTTWTLQARLLASDAQAGDSLGTWTSISSDGNTVLLTAIGEDTSPNSTNGAAYIFTRSGTLWTQQTKLLASDARTNDYFGFSADVSSDGNTALVGTWNIGDTNNINGAGYVFTRAGTNWTQQTKLVSDDLANNDSFASRLSLSSDGKTAFVGAISEDTVPNTDNGAVYVFVGTQPTATPTSTASSTPTHTPTATNTPIPARPDTIGAYKDGAFYLRNSNSAGSANIIAAFGGDASDLPIAGDWNGDGVDTIGIYRGSTGVYFLSDSNIAPAVNYSLVFGNPGDTPFAGKWINGATRDGVGVYRNSNGILYQKNDLTTGFSDYFAVFGNPGDQGVGGDWDANGLDSVGIYRSSNLTWFMSNNPRPDGITFSDIDFVWNIGSASAFVGDWDGDGDSTPGSLTAAGVFTLHPNNAATGADISFAFGPTGSKPIAGKWAAPGQPSISGVISGGTGNYTNAGLDDKTD